MKYLLLFLKQYFSNIDNLSSLSNDKCLTDARKRMGRKMGAATSNSFKTKRKKQTMDTAGLAEFGYTGTGNLSLTGPITKVGCFDRNVFCCYEMSQEIFCHAGEFLK